MTASDSQPRRPGAAPPQDNLQRAVRLAFEALAAQTEEQLRWLGAEPMESGCRLPVLEDVVEVDRSTQRLTASAGGEVGPAWAILVLHYLAVSSCPEDSDVQTTFADLATARSYTSVYQGRVIGRLCATTGRDAEILRAAADTLGGRAVSGAGGDVAYDFRMFPRLSLRLIWHAPDDEFPPSATLLLPGNVESYFCSEDIVVMSELLVARLGGKPF